MSGGGEDADRPLSVKERMKMFNKKKKNKSAGENPVRRRSGSSKGLEALRNRKSSTKVQTQYDMIKKQKQNKSECDHPFHLPSGVR